MEVARVFFKKKNKSMNMLLSYNRYYLIHLIKWLGEQQGSLPKVCINKNINKIANVCVLKLVLAIKKTPSLSHFFLLCISLSKDIFGNVLGSYCFGRKRIKEKKKRRWKTKTKEKKPCSIPIIIIILMLSFFFFKFPKASLANPNAY